MRKIELALGEYYHVFNRGVDKRDIFLDWNDIKRFYQSMEEFNVIDPIGSIYENSFRKDKLGNRISKQEKLVDFICYCLNPNHYHFILKQLADRGIEKFMHRLGIGYTKYFNEKCNRSGVLFQGAFKAEHVSSNTYLLHLSAYVSLNNKVHKLGNSVSKSSWKEYMTNKNSICDKDVILGEFKNIQEYKTFALNSLRGIRERKELEKLLIER